MFTIRPATVDDREPMAEMITDRASWMHRNGLRGADGWARNADLLASQAGDPEWPVWVLVADDGPRLLE